MSIDSAFTHFPTLTTNRLHLRQIRPADAEALFEIRSNRAVMDFYGEEPHQSLADTHALIQQIRDAYERREALLWGIALKEEDIIIGSCTFFAFGPGFHYVETGYDLHQAYWRRGIMAEAMPAILTYGFTELGLHRIEAATDPRNTPSKNLLLKLGFTYEGNLRQRFFFRNQFLDAQYFGLLKDEWLKSR
jgi:[ribosomal protein S5]-alanine N-acetyltransferase